MIERFLDRLALVAIVLLAIGLLFVVQSSTPRPSPAAIPAAPSSVFIGVSGNLPARTGAPNGDAEEARAAIPGVVVMGSRPRQSAGSGGSAASLPSARPLSCRTPCHVDVSRWDAPPDVSVVAQNGIASHMGYGFPSWYLALPIGPGYVARICGPAACITRTSNDAGPAKWLQRAPYNRVADLSVADFELVCGCSSSMGLVNVSVAILGRAK